MVVSRELAERLLAAFAGSDLAVVESLSVPDIVVFGTDVHEDWRDRPTLLEALDGMRSLGLRARWRDDLVLGDGWAAGTADYTLSDGSTLPVRVSLSFTGERLTHAHFSVAQPVAE
jgi:hypothetical protein